MNSDYFISVRPEDGYFVRDLGSDTVTCPAGNTLRRKCTKSNGYARYSCKSACYRCSELYRCYRGKGHHKEVDFFDGAMFVKCRNWMKEA